MFFGSCSNKRKPSDWHSQVKNNLPRWSKSCRQYERELWWEYSCHRSGARSLTLFPEQAIPYSGKTDPENTVLLLRVALGIPENRERLRRQWKVEDSEIHNYFKVDFQGNKSVNQIMREKRKTMNPFCILKHGLLILIKK